MASEKIIIIDDEEAMLHLLRIELEAEGFIVFSALDGKAGLDLIEKNRPDLIILDVMMPDLNGYEILTRLKGNKSTKDIPVMMLTAKGLDGDIQKGLELGVDEYITKPFHAGLLVKRIQMLLRHSAPPSH